MKKKKTKKVEKRDASDSTRHSAPPFLADAEALASVRILSRMDSDSNGQMFASSEISGQTLITFSISKNRPLESWCTHLAHFSLDSLFSDCCGGVVEVLF